MYLCTLCQKFYTEYLLMYAYFGHLLNILSQEQCHICQHYILLHQCYILYILLLLYNIVVILLLLNLNKI